MVKLAKRIFLFLLVNFLILITISLTFYFLGIGNYLNQNGIDYQSLAVFCLGWGMGGAFISLGLSRLMAKWMMGVQVIDPNTSDPTLSWLVNTVYKLARAAGLNKMPEVGVYDSPEINAFATGPTRNRALVAVSSGMLRNMNDEQIEGVLGHEISHISNGDMVTMTLLQGIINAIVMFLARVIAFFVTRIITRNSDKDSSSLRYLLTFVLEIVLSFFGMMVVAAFSRYREFKADEGGATLAGREKMISALEGLLETLAYADMTHKESLSAFKISGTPRFLRLLATHPPLEERIKRLKRNL